MSISTLNAVATNVDITDVGGEQIVDFDIEANTDYEIQSCVMVDEDDNVVEAAVRFGRVEERPELGIGKPILYSAWTSMVQDATGFDVLEPTALEADMSDFSHIVPHLRIERENVEVYGCDTLTIDEFTSTVSELAELVEGVFRADDRTINRKIDDYL